MYEKPAGVKSIDIKEIGPRFELRLYQVLPSFYYSLVFILLQNFSRISFCMSILHMLQHMSENGSCQACCEHQIHGGVLLHVHERLLY
jgi:hypothetical protein